MKSLRFPTGAVSYLSAHHVDLADTGVFTLSGTTWSMGAATDILLAGCRVDRLDVDRAEVD